MTEKVPVFSPDPVKDRARRALLTKLAANTRNPAAAELARELLAGNVTPRRILGSNLYSDLLDRTTSGLTDWYGNLSEADKEKLADAGQKALSRLAVEDEPVTPRRASRSASDEEDFSEVDWLDG